MSVDPLSAFWSFPGEHTEIPLERIGEYPLLAECLEVWRRQAADRLPATVDPVLFPRAAIRGLNLIEYLPETDDWRIRLVGSLVTDHVGRELRGTGLTQNFSEPDRASIRATLQAAAARRTPDLMRRIFHDQRGMSWAYIRLFLPLSSDGTAVDRFASVIDPGSFGRLTSGPTTTA